MMAYNTTKAAATNSPVGTTPPLLSHAAARHLEDGTNGLEAGVTEMLDRMHTGRLKVFSHLAEWFEECSLYHRDNGRITKRHDDLLSATRYAMMMRRYAKITNPVQIAVYEYTVDY
ncbi:hypothetical protein [Xylella fastidiosa]|uniref:phage terminase large subunit family protein n=1 Tax=Xylella fastidiosa TaxID=2371 RepID=UPI003AFA2D4D